MSRGETQTTAAGNEAQPWTGNASWREGAIADGPSWALAGVLWGFTLFWFGILVIVASVVPTSAAGGPGDEARVLYFGAFAVAGLAPASLALLITLRNLKYGRSVFEMARVPGVIGGRLEGVVRAPAGLALDRGVETALICRSSQLTRHNRVSSSLPVWRDEVHYDAHQLSQTRGATEIPISFEIPFQCMPTDAAPNPSRRIEWALWVKARAFGADFVAEFAVPVYRTPDSDPSVTGRGLNDTCRQPPGSKVKIVDRAEAGTLIRLPRRHWDIVLALVLLLIPLASGPMSRLAMLKDVPFALVLMGSFVPSLLWSAIVLIGLATTPSRIEIQRDELRVRWALWPIAPIVSVSTSDITSVRHEVMGEGDMASYNVLVVEKGGREHWAAVGMTLEEAMWLEGELQRHCREEAQRG